MDSMSLRDMLFWICLATFETGMFVTFDQHVDGGIVMIVLGLGGMIGCAWPRLKSGNVRSMYLWIFGVVTILVLAASVIAGIVGHDREKHIADPELQMKPDLMAWIVNPAAPQLLIWPVGTLARDVKSDPLLWDIDRDDIISSTSLIVNEMKYDWIRSDQHGGPSALLDQRDVQNVVKPGHRIFGYITITCPDCDRVRLYWIYFIYAQGGWFAEIPRGVAPNPKAIGDSIPSLRNNRAAEKIIVNMISTSRITIEDESRLHGMSPK